MTDKTHMHGEGPTGWETLCGRQSHSLTAHPELVDCVQCLRKMEMLSRNPSVAALEGGETNLYYFAVTVSLHETSSITRSFIAGWRLAENEDVVRQEALEAANKSKPGFQVDEIIVGQIPIAALGIGSGILGEEG